MGGGVGGVLSGDLVGGGGGGDMGPWSSLLKQSPLVTLTVVTCFKGNGGGRASSSLAVESVVPG